MAKTYDTLDERLCRFIQEQHLFFVATAPLEAEAHVNLSPKGIAGLRVLDERTVAYLDFVGSGAETIAHLRQNGRITLLFCAFAGPPKILRLYGRGEVLEPQDATFAELRSRMLEHEAGQGTLPNVAPEIPTVRAIIVVRLSRIADACGFGVPEFEYKGERRQLQDFCARKGESGMLEYQRDKNSQSIDGLPALRWTKQRPRE